MEREPNQEIKEQYAVYHQILKDFIPELTSEGRNEVLLAAINSSETLSKVYASACNTWEIRGRDKQLPRLQNVLDNSINAVLNIYQMPLALLLPLTHSKIPLTGQNDWQRVDVAAGQREIFDGSCPPIRINGDYLAQCAAVEFKDMTPIESLLAKTEGYKFVFNIDNLHLTKGTEFESLDNVIVTAVIGKPATYQIGGKGSETVLINGDATTLPTTFLTEVLYSYLTQLRKISLESYLHVTNWLKEYGAANLKQGGKAVAEMTDKELILKGALCIAATNGFGASTYGNESLNTLSTFMTVVAYNGTERGTILQSAHSCSVQRLMFRDKDEETSGVCDELLDIYRQVLTMIMLEVAKTGCHTALSYEASLAKHILTDKPKNKRKSPKSKKTSANNPLGRRLVDIKEYGNDLVLTLTSDTGKRTEWKGGTIKVHQRKAHTRLQMKGRGPNKRKEQVFVKACLVTGSKARLQREKRATAQRIHQN